MKPGSAFVGRRKRLPYLSFEVDWVFVKDQAAEDH